MHMALTKAHHVVNAVTKYLAKQLSVAHSDTTCVYLLTAVWASTDIKLNKCTSNLHH